MRHVRIAMVGLMLFWGAGGAAWGVSCAGSQLAYTETGNAAMNFPLCSSRACQTPTNNPPVYSFDSPGCDPNLGACAMTATVEVKFPGNHQNDPASSGFFYSFAQVTLRNLPSGGLVGQCGTAGAVIAQDKGTATVKASVACSSATNRYRLELTMCPEHFCLQQKSVSLDFALAAGCPIVPPDDCNTCGGCVTDGGGGGCSNPVRGDGPFCEPEGSGPGAHLRYRAGGAGGTGLPGATGWRTSLGLYWAHDYARRIVPAPDASRVWLVTERAGFIGFSGLAGGSGLRLYGTNAPSDEYRRLYYDNATGGWQLDGLDGRRDFFRPDGLWEKTVWAQNLAHPTVATYSGSQLTEVTFPDGRSEIFSYHPSGKLASITEMPVPGSGGTPRVWSYVWSGDLLTHIGRPDGTAWEFTYDLAKNGGRPGYLTQIRRIGTDGVTGRVETVFEYDDAGNVIRSWSGDPIYTGPNAVHRQEYIYDNPEVPARTEVRHWLDATQSQVTVYEFDRDPRSPKARINKITSDCPACGVGPNAQMTYADPAHPLLPTQIVDGRGLRTQYAYDANGQMTSKTEAATTSLSRTSTYEYGNASFPALPTRMERPSTSGGSAERVMIYSYDTSGNPVTRTVQGAEAGSSFSYATTTTYNAAGQPLTMDPPGHGTTDVTTYTYDPARGDLLPLTRTDPLVGATSFGYDGFNRRTSGTDPNGVETVTAFDALNRVTAVTQKGATPAEDLTTAHVYNLFGDLFRTVLPRGNVIEYGYDAAGRLISIERKSDAATPGERTLYTLNVFGQRIREELQRWNGTAWVTESFTDSVYSTRCHLDKTVHADGTVNEYAYDCDGNLEKVWDAKHPRASNPNPTQLYAYDALNRLTSVTQPWAGAGGGTAVTSYQYDVQDHLTRVTDAEGNITNYTYSDRDLMTAQVSPVSGTTTYAYDEHGELVTEIDARGIVMARTVDALDRVTTVTYPNPALNIAYTYDDPSVSFSKGRLTRIARHGEAVDYQYDRFGRVLQDGALTYTWDANGNPATILYPGGVKAVYGYDFADRPETLLAQRPAQPDQPLVTAATYLPAGPLSSLALGNGLTETRSFTSRYFPAGITLGGHLNWTYSTDAVGNILAITDTLNAVNNRTYGYQDIHYFLTQGNGPWGPRAFTYDRIGNRLTEARGAVTDTYSYLSNGTGRTPILSQIQLGTGGTRTYQFGLAGHLERTATGTDATLFLTDAAGRLFALERPSTQSGAIFRYDGRDYLSLADSEALSFRDGFETGDVCSWSGATGLFSVPVCTIRPAVRSIYNSEGFLHSLHRNVAPQSSYVFHFAGRPVAQLDISSGTESWKWLTADHLGTPIVATSAGGAMLWQGGFEPFGADWSGAGGAGVFLRFPGQWENGAWGASSERLYYNLHRYYRPNTGSYIKPDPLSLQGDTNPYAYARLNPLSYTDPLGLVSYRNFPSDKQKEAEEAVRRVRQKLKEEPCCIGKDGRASDLLAYLDHPDFVIEYRPKSKLCGVTPFLNMIDANRRIGLGPLAWTPGCCVGGNAGINSLASTILHELVHATYNVYKHPAEAEQICFGCSQAPE